ncbi:MAG: serine hydrolase domain-containing protein, partial [Bacteroidota bacterium]
ALLLINCSGQESQIIQDYLQELSDSNQFNGNVLVIKSDTSLYRQSFGFAKGNRAEKLTEHHLFQIGSIYKEFPAVAIMQFEEKGLLSLEDSLSHFLPELPLWASDIQIKHLLQYSSGLPLIDWSALFQGDEKVSLELVLMQLKNVEELEFFPGSDYLYSNYNPMLLIRVIEQLADMGFKQYLEQHIFIPYGIDGIVLANQFPFTDTPSEIFAAPFNEYYQEDHLAYELPSICASLNGIQQWFEKLDNFQIITEKSVKRLSEEVIEGTNIQSPLGRADWEGNELQLHLHHGSTGNYECLVRHYKSKEVMIILLTNRKQRNLHSIADRIYHFLNKPN